jgi:hypothetical protein
MESSSWRQPSPVCYANDATLPTPAAGPGTAPEPVQDTVLVLCRMLLVGKVSLLGQLYCGVGVTAGEPGATANTLAVQRPSGAGAFVWALYP